MKHRSLARVDFAGERFAETSLGPDVAPSRRRAGPSKRCSLLCAVALPVLLAGLGACESLTHGCTEIGCSDGLTVTFEHGPWETGHYRFELTVDGKNSSCEVDLPLPQNPQNVCSDARALLGLSGSALPSDQQSISDLVFTEGWRPKKLAIVVFKDDAELGATELEPSYKRVAPNGEGCAPVCQQANATFEF